MADNKKRILEMVAEKKITIDEAIRLLELVDKPETSSAPTKAPKYLRVVINPGTEGRGKADVERVNIRVPLALIHAGVKLTSLIPDDVSGKVNSALREKGIDFNLKNLKEEDIEQLVEALSDLEVDIEGGTGKVNVYTE
ncbi:unnamed protein product [marine sediment metagenome]|uniref:YvlB/LiaX N-terminal domain-containing protein n=1 Tax=marine sediment metagenome TaxID=412755 RepID=X1SC24_9ZZZZ